MVKTKASKCSVNYNVDATTFKIGMGRLPKTQRELDIFADCCLEVISNLVEDYDGLLSMAGERTKERLEGE